MSDTGLGTNQLKTQGWIHHPMGRGGGRSGGLRDTETGQDRRPPSGARSGSHGGSGDSGGHGGSGSTGGHGGSFSRGRWDYSIASEEALFWSSLLSQYTRGTQGSQEHRTRRQGTSYRILYLETRNTEITEIAGYMEHTLMTLRLDKDTGSTEDL